MTAANKQLILRYIDGLNRQDWKAVEECLSPGLVRHSVATPDLQIDSRAAFLHFIRENAVAFPDVNHEIEMMVAEGDLVACYLRLTGTQTGPLGPMLPSGRQVNMPFLSFLRVENETIAEMWVEWDNVFFLSQLGLVPEGWPMDPPDCNNDSGE